ncbi:sensor histidine kinase [Propionibacteriaceae bacterium Y1685]
MNRHADRLPTRSVRLRATISVLAVVLGVLAGLALVVDTVVAAQSERNLDALLTGRIQLAQQLAKSGVGPRAVVNRVQADGVQAHIVLRSGVEFGTPPPTGDEIRSVDTRLNGRGQMKGARLTLSIDTALVSDSRAILRGTLLFTGGLALVASTMLIIAAVSVSLAPLSTMARLAHRIADGERGWRLRPTRPNTEIGRTAAAFDEMLDALEGAEARARSAEDRSKSFLADATHELRTPIAGIRASAETLTQYGAQLSPAEQERLLRLLGEEAHRAALLVDDLLATAHLDSQTPLERRPTDLSRLLSVEASRQDETHPGTTVTFTDRLTGLAPVDVDPDRLQGVVRNLISNAARAAGPQGFVAIEASVEGEGVVITVDDSGPGVPEPDRERIFDRMVRLDSGRAPGDGGSGLGLAIARGYARAHGGDVVCLGTGPLGGARFALTLPT